jgi:hypothetical protein
MGFVVASFASLRETEFRGFTQRVRAKERRASSVLETTAIRKGACPLFSFLFSLYLVGVLNCELLGVDYQSRTARAERSSRECFLHFHLRLERAVARWRYFFEAAPYFQNAIFATGENIRVNGRVHAGAPNILVAKSGSPLRDLDSVLPMKETLFEAK